MIILRPWVVPLWKGCQLREMLGDTEEMHWLRLTTKLLNESLNCALVNQMELSATYTLLSNVALDHYHRLRDERMLREYRLRLEAAA
jgi:hypothetical protein